MASLHMLVVSYLASLVLLGSAYADHVPALFIFGDSTVDVGTNNNLPESLARADTPPYGIDYPNSIATGRFSNGFTSVDFLSKLMGLKTSAQPFLSLLRQPNGLHDLASSGVNFASAGSGLLDTTGKAFQKVIPASEQIQQFMTFKSNLTAIKGLQETNTTLSKSIFCISSGSNDIFTYISGPNTIPQHQFIAMLMNSYEGYIKALYNLGARKFGIISLAPLGCCPAQRLLSPTAGSCYEVLNDFARAYNSALSNLISKFASEFPDIKYSLADTYFATINLINTANLFNITNVDSACCGTGKLNAETQCNAASTVCSNRNQFLFWDWFHPTEYAFDLFATTLFSGGLEFMTPINFSQLANA